MVKPQSDRPNVGLFRRVAIKWFDDATLSNMSDNPYTLTHSPESNMTFISSH